MALSPFGVVSRAGSVPGTGGSNTGLHRHRGAGAVYTALPFVVLITAGPAAIGMLTVSGSRFV